MSSQKISYPVYGARVQRVLNALTPLVGAAAPTKHASYIGQLYVETTTPALYVSVATDSAVPANDWSLSTIAAVPAAVEAAMADLYPLTGVVAPAEHADFIGQLYVDTALGKGYMAVATDSASAADDWKEITLS